MAARIGGCRRWKGRHLVPLQSAIRRHLHGNKRAIPKARLRLLSRSGAQVHLLRSRRYTVCALQPDECCVTQNAATRRFCPLRAYSQWLYCCDLNNRVACRANPGCWPRSDACVPQGKYQPSRSEPLAVNSTAKTTLGTGIDAFRQVAFIVTCYCREWAPCNHRSFQARRLFNHSPATTFGDTSGSVRPPV